MTSQNLTQTQILPYIKYPLMELSKLMLWSYTRFILDKVQNTFFIKLNGEEVMVQIRDIEYSSDDCIDEVKYTISVEVRNGEVEKYIDLRVVFYHELDEYGYHHYKLLVKKEFISGFDLDERELTMLSKIVYIVYSRVKRAWKYLVDVAHSKISNIILNGENWRK